jgi:hypothetical protein
VGAPQAMVLLSVRDVTGNVTYWTSAPGGGASLVFTAAAGAGQWMEGKDGGGGGGECG